MSNSIKHSTSPVPFKSSLSQGNFSDQTKIVIKDGIKYKIEVLTVEHGILWRVYQAAQAILMTILALAWVYSHDNIKAKWLQVLTGKESTEKWIEDKKPKLPMLERSKKSDEIKVEAEGSDGTKKIEAEPPLVLEKEQPKPEKLNPLIEENVPTAPIINTGAVNVNSHPTLSEDDQNSFQKDVKGDYSATYTDPAVGKFLKHAESDLEGIEIIELISELDKIFAIIAEIQDPYHRTTVFTVIEKVAQHYLKANLFKKAQEIRIKAALAFPPSQPLANLKSHLQKEDPKLGIRINQLGTSQVKNHTLAIQRQWFEYEDKPRLHLEGKLCHHTQENLRLTLNHIQKQQVDFFNTLPKDFCKSFSIKTGLIAYPQRKPSGKFDHYNQVNVNIYKQSHPKHSESLILNFQGVGVVQIGNTRKDRTNYNRLIIDLNPALSEDEALKKLHILFSALGLGALSSKTRKVDEKRIKIMQLFRAFYPREAYDLERSEKIYEESIKKLKNRISLKVPAMKPLLKKYFKESPELMYKQEVYPGQYVWCVKGLADLVREKGGYGLMAGVKVPKINIDDLPKYNFDHIVSILKHGALSTQDRYQVGLTIQGLSSNTDILNGGASSVFTRLVSESQPMEVSKYPYKGELQILYDLDLIERVGYVYPEDKFGIKKKTVYANRPSVIELLDVLPELSKKRILQNNEVCIQGRISPKYIKGILTDSVELKNNLMLKLKKEGLISKNAQNIDCVNGIPIDQFIHVGTTFKKSFWS